MSNIIVPLKSEMAGRFKIEAVRPDGTRRILADWFDNLILNAGLDRMGSADYNGYVSGCAVGTGNSTPVVTQTALDNRIAWTTNIYGTSNGYQVSTLPYYGWAKFTYRFGVGAAQGNLSEVGVGWKDNGGLYVGLYSRALILDGNGNPTTITVLSDEILDVTYELRVYAPNPLDTTTQVTISGSQYNITVRPYSMNYYWHPISASRAGVSFYNSGAEAIGMALYRGTTTLGNVVNGQPNGTGYQVTDYPSVSDSGYTPGSYKRVRTCVWDYTKIQSGLNCLTWLMAKFCGNYCDPSHLGAWQCLISPQIPKDATNQLTLVIESSWSRRT